MSLENVRKEIDAIDAELIPLLKKRMLCSLEVAKIKKEQNLPILNEKREQEIIENVHNFSTCCYPFYVNPFLKDKSIRMINFTVFTF